MAEAQTIQTSFLSGVLDPRAKGRIDTDAYAQGLLLGVNIEPIHLGGIRRRRGSRFLDRLPYQLTRLTSGITVTAPRGGTTGNANDDNESTLVTTTTNVSTIDPYVVVHYDLGSAQSVNAVDVVGIASTGGSSTEFCVQYSADNASWTTLGSALGLVDTTARSYRRTNTDFHTAISARYWRLAKVGGTDMGSVTISISGFNLWTETSTISNVRLFNFEVNADDRFILALTDRSGALYDSDGVLDTYLPMPYESADLPDIDAASSADTMVLVHEDYAPRFVLRELSGLFSTEIISFDEVPQYDFGDSSSPAPTSDVQVITFASASSTTSHGPRHVTDSTAGWQAGDTFQIELDGARTGSIRYAGDANAAEQAATAANIAREVQKLYTVPGFDGVTCARTGSLEYTVTLAGASAYPYGLMTVIPLDSAATATVAHSVTGVARSEPVWSSTRGWPRTAAFFEGRLYFGGTRSRQQTIFGSRVNSILDFKIQEGLAADPIAITLDGSNAIQGLFAGRSFEVFTTSGEYRYLKPQGEAVTPGDTPKSQTFNGSAKIRPVNIDGSTMYVQRKRKSLRDYKYNYEIDAYDSLGVSSLAPHLVYDVRDIAVYTGSRQDEINLVMLVNGTNPDTSSDAFADGTLAILNTRKESNIQAWTIWTTDGEYKAVATSFEDIFTVVKRTINGTDWLFLEIGDTAVYTDASVTPTIAGATLSGLDVYDGEELRVKADGFVLANITPSGGSATVDDAGYTDVVVGLDFNPMIQPMPLAPNLPRGSSVGAKRRIREVSIMVRNTLGLRLNGRILPTRQLDVMNLDEAAAPYTGVLRLEETTNWDRDLDKIILLDQVDPLPMEILLIEAKLEG